MKNLVRVLGLVFALALVGLAAKAHKLTGKVGDSMCGAKNTSTTCVSKCIKKGMKAVLVRGHRVYTFANSSELNSYAGKRVTVTYTVARQNHKIVRTIESVKAS